MKRNSLAAFAVAAVLPATPLAHGALVPPPPQKVLGLALRSEPTVPEAGRAFTITVLGVRLEHGNPEPGDLPKPDSVRCSATLDGRAIGGSGKSGCSWQIPAHTVRTVFSADVTATYHGQTLARKLAWRVRGSGISPAATRRPAQAPATFRNLRICSSTAFSRLDGRCTKDERKLMLVSNRITCSVDILVRKPGVLNARFLYDGVGTPFKPVFLAPGAHHYWINEDLGIDLPLPGGHWGCSYSFGGRSIQASFTSGGPAGEIVDTAACREVNLIVRGTYRACRSDESAGSIAATNSIWCFAVFAGATTKDVELQIVSNERILRSTSFIIGGPIWAGWIHFAAPPGENIAAGSYTCRFALDDGTVSEKPFEIAA